VGELELKNRFFKQGIISFYRIIDGKKEMKLWIALKN
jgi:hypothetical protein